MIEEAYTVAGNIEIKGASHEIRKGNTCYKVAERARTWKSRGPSPHWTIEEMKVTKREKGAKI